MGKNVDPQAGKYPRNPTKIPYTHFFQELAYGKNLLVNPSFQLDKSKS